MAGDDAEVTEDMLLLCTLLPSTSPPPTTNHRDRVSVGGTNLTPPAPFPSPTKHIGSPASAHTRTIRAPVPPLSPCPSGGANMHPRSKRSNNPSSFSVVIDSAREKNLFTRATCRVGRRIAACSFGQRCGP